MSLSPPGLILVEPVSAGSVPTSTQKRCPPWTVERTLYSLCLHACHGAGSRQVLPDQSVSYLVSGDGVLAAKVLNLVLPNVSLGRIDSSTLSRNKTEKQNQPRRRSKQGEAASGEIRWGLCDVTVTASGTRHQPPTLCQEFETRELLAAYGPWKVERVPGIPVASPSSLGHEQSDSGFIVKFGLLAL
ncbi:hypothetical protein J1605_006430 [Eschrichtius robustus]|uniref:Uncharacterized protein n=1 Tax=Eschrichtius robustus TaxID=9764 RepID=A0AB34H695_ESCRO|nr:hypothetical protein J1605_006430 [Eschrichtius robustus]